MPHPLTSHLNPSEVDLYALSGPHNYPLGYKSKPKSMSPNSSIVQVNQTNSNVDDHTRLRTLLLTHLQVLNANNLLPC